MSLCDIAKGQSANEHLSCEVRYLYTKHDPSLSSGPLAGVVGDSRQLCELGMV